MDPVAAALHRLGRPVTRGRGEVLRILSESSIPLSSREILERFPEPRPDAATVYRSLSLLLSAGMVRAVDLRGRSRRYESALGGDHRHRVVCRACGRIESYRTQDCGLSGIESDIRKRLGFRVEEHTLEFFGECRACLRKEARR